MSTSQHPFPNAEAFDQIARLLAELLDDANKTFDEIHRIAEVEAQQFDEDSDERHQWAGFAAWQVFSDAGRALTGITDRITALRGSLVYRGLDPCAPKRKDI